MTDTQRVLLAVAEMIERFGPRGYGTSALFSEGVEWGSNMLARRIREVASGCHRPDGAINLLRKLP